MKAKSLTRKDFTATRNLEFADNRLLPELYGAHGSHLARIEQLLDVSLTNRGNKVQVAGAELACAQAAAVLTGLYQRLESGAHISLGDIDGALRFAQQDIEGFAQQDIERFAQENKTELAEKNKKTKLTAIKTAKLTTPKREILARSPTQAAYIEALTNASLVLGLGPAGTGKTYLACAAAAVLLQAGKVERVILSRPAIEAGERLGFLPGDMREKVDPYLRPLYDALYDMLPSAKVERALEAGDIEIAPLAFMRGRTLRNAFVILDEAQNATPTQMKMFLTRLGEGSHMVVNGDPSQIDLPAGQESGLSHALDVLAPLVKQADAAIKIIRFGAGDVVRHDLVAKIIIAYEKYNKGRNK